MSFKITSDLIDDGKLNGRLFATPGRPFPFKHLSPDTPSGLTFRLLDDDDEVYFEGEYYGKYESFEPLDSLGEGYGCTAIQYKRGAAWVTL